MFIFQLVEACHQYNKHKTDIIKICNALFVIFHQKFVLCRYVPKVPYGSYAPDPIISNRRSMDKTVNVFGRKLL